MPLPALVEQGRRRRRSISASPATRFEASKTRIAAAQAAGADILVTLGGASVGEHDLVQSALTPAGHAARLLARRAAPGQAADASAAWAAWRCSGLPGNPVSSIVCGILFLVPAVRALLGDPEAGADPTEPALLGSDCPANDGRQDYLRATLAPDPDGAPVATLHARQDSSMLGILAALRRAPRSRSRTRPPPRPATAAESSASSASC